MNDQHEDNVEEPSDSAGSYEPPAVIALGKLDELTFGAAGPPFEGATSYL